MTMDWEVDKVLGIFKKKISVCAPFDGRTMDMTEVRDPVFAQLMMGDGCALIPASGDVLAPVSGRVELVAGTGHAICLKTEEGLELMIHYGIDTVKFAGKGFEVKAAVGQQVRVGDLLCHDTGSGLQSICSCKQTVGKRRDSRGTHFLCCQKIGGL